MTVILKLLMGSRIYGTAGPDSDFDYKEIYLPDLDNMLLGKKVKNYQRNVEDGELESVPLQVYLDHFFEGQTYALELAFLACVKFPHQHSWIKVLIDQFLTRDIQKMMGYAVAQSRIYGLKAERATQIQQAYDLIIAASIVDPTILMLKLEDCGPLKELQHLPFVRQIEIQSTETKMVPAIEINGKKFPYSATWQVVANSLQRSLNLYGERAKSYAEAQADLKALSHAIRVIEQINELCQTGRITFPRHNAGFLKDVKYGRVSVTEARNYLEKRFEEVEFAVDTSTLPERTPQMENDFQAFKIKVLREYYGLA